MNKFLLLMFLLIPVFVHSQTVTKVLISGQDPTHDTEVKTAFLQGYASYNGASFTGQVDLHTDYNAYSALDYAHQNNYQIAVRSYTGITADVDNYAKNYPDVLLFMPAGSNSYIFVCNLDIPNSSVVSTGAGTDSLVTGYKVEFFSIDPITGSNLSSYSNGYIAGQIALIANNFDVPFSEARNIARNHASNISQTAGNVAYGEINIASAITTPLPVELSSFSGSANGNEVELKWQTATEVNNYGFELQRLQDYKITPLQDWEDIGFIKGSGNSSSPKNYSFIDNNPLGDKVKYRLKQINNDGTFKYSAVVDVQINSENITPGKFELFQNYPNPFNPSTVIQYEIPKQEKVVLKVYNILGNEISTLVNENEQPGNYQVQFNANQNANTSGGQTVRKNFPSGVYLYRLQAGNYSSVKKFILLK